MKAFLWTIFPRRLHFGKQLEVFCQFVVLELFVGWALVVKLAPESEGLGVVDLVSAPFSFSSVAARQPNLTRAGRQRRLWRGAAVPRGFNGASPVTSCFKHL